MFTWSLCNGTLVRWTSLLWLSIGKMQLSTNIFLAMACSILPNCCKHVISFEIRMTLYFFDGESWGLWELVRIPKVTPENEGDTAKEILEYFDGKFEVEIYGREENRNGGDSNLPRFFSMHTIAPIQYWRKGVLLGSSRHNIGDSCWILGESESCFLRERMMARNK